MTPDFFVDLIQEDPWSWYWDSHVQAEVFRLLPYVWDHSDDNQRDSIITLTLEGPPRDRYKDNIKPEEWKRLRDRLVWQRLARIAKASSPLTELAQAQLAELEEHRPSWKLTGDPTEDLVFSISSGWGHDASTNVEELARMTSNQQLGLLIEEGYYREGDLDVWDGVVRAQPKKGFLLLRLAVHESRLDSELLTHTFQGLAEAEGADAQFLEGVRWVLERVPSDAWGSAVHPMSRTVTRLVKKVEPALLEESLVLWDLAFPITFDKPSGMEGGDPVTWALNHPAGRLIDGLLDRMRTEVTKGEQQIPELFRVRYEMVLNQHAGEGEDLGAGQAARIMICLRLSWLHWLNQEWAEENVVPLLDWTNPQEALGAWEAFLWAPHLSPELWSSVRPHLPATFEHCRQNERSTSRLAEVIISAYIAGFPIDDEEVRNLLRTGRGNALKAAANYIAEVLKGADEKAEQLWRGHIEPLLQHGWPKELDLITVYVADALAVAAIRSGAAFSEAVPVVEPFLVRQDHPREILKELNDSLGPVDAPQATMDLLNAVLLDEAVGVSNQLRGVLFKVKGAWEEAEAHPAWNRLADIAERE